MQDTSIINSTSSQTAVIDGKRLAHLRGDPAARAHTAADLYSGAVLLNSLTQCAGLAHVGPTSVRRILRAPSSTLAQ